MISNPDSNAELIERVVMSKSKVEKQVKIFGTIVMLGGLSLYILEIYFVYNYGSFLGFLDIYFLLFGSLLLIAGIGLVKLRNWARKMMLFNMALYFLVGMYELLSWAVIIFFVSTDYHLFMYAVIVFVITFVIMILFPTIGVFCLLNKKQIKDVFGQKAITNQSGA